MTESLIPVIFNGEIFTHVEGVLSSLCVLAGPCDSNVTVVKKSALGEDGEAVAMV